LQARAIRSPELSLQIDESADVGLAPLLLFVRYCFKEIAQEEFVFSLPLSERCARQMNDCFTAEDISGVHRVAMCTDGAAGPTGHKKGKGSQAEAQQIDLHVNFIRCIILGDALASRDCKPKLSSVLQVAM
jgi:hypothetical protein